MASSTRVLMVYPKFIPNSFWNYTEACELVGAKYPAAPLGLITVAAMLPKEWDVRLVNRNTEALTDADTAWADLIMIGGMLNQQPDFLYLIEFAHLHGKPVCVGGPDVSSSPHLYAAADFQVIGEAEHIMADFIAAWERGERKGVFTAEKFKIDMTQSPLPRYDLLKLEQYLYIGIQFSRGCPFTCEFCDIIELYGRVPRTKTEDQIFAELQALYDRGYRGHVDFVDDNFIGNRKHVRPMMPKLKQWLQQHDYPFEFTTEASINIADDDDMLQAMKDANFFGIFVGIESPDPETLIQMRKKQNTKRNIAESIHKIYSYGMFVTAGFILGFDTEKVSIAHSMTEFIEDTSVPVCMVGLALRAARHAADASAREGRPPAQGPRHHARRAGWRPMHARLQLRYQAPVARHPDRLQNRSGERVQPRGLRRPAIAHGRDDGPLRAAEAARRRRHPEGSRRRRALQDHADASRGTRAVLEDLRRHQQVQSRRASSDRDADGDVPAPRTVLQARDQGDRAAHFGTG